MEQSDELSSPGRAPADRSILTGIAMRAGLALIALLGPSAALACACGCGVFDVGTGAMFPGHSGGMVFVESDFLNQNRNWSGTSSAPADDNEDRQIKSEFYSVGAQYMFNRSWGAQIDIPYWNRRFTTVDDTDTLVTNTHAALGDIRIRGLYTGFSPDMSTGVSFGLKLATGDSTYANFDPDTQIGSGSTDLLLGAYHLGKITDDGAWNYYVRGQWQQPIAHKASYRPGAETVGVIGAYFHGWSFGSASRVSPLLQVTAAFRGHDGGPLGEPDNTGYKRLIVQPGIQINAGNFSVYVEGGFAFYDKVTGNQLISRRLYKVNFGYSF